MGVRMKDIISAVIFQAIYSESTTAHIYYASSGVCI